MIKRVNFSGVKLEWTLHRNKRSFAGRKKEEILVSCIHECLIIVISQFCAFPRAHVLRGSTLIRTRIHYDDFN